MFEGYILEGLKSRLLPPYMRVQIWMALLRRVAAPDTSTRIMLVMSAIADTTLSILAAQRAVSPKTLFAGSVVDRSTGARFFFRRGTDDLYNVMPSGEMDVHEAILAPLSPGDVFVDVGANVGYYTTLAALRVGERGQVVAFEANPLTAEQLRRNIAANDLGNVKVVEAAAFDGSAVCATIYVPRNVFGMASVHENGASGVAAYPVECTTIAAECNELPRIKMLKMDIEGAEYEALRGAGSVLDRVENIVVECNRRADEIVALLMARGFAVRKLQFGPYLLGSREALPGTRQISVLPPTG